MNRIMNSPAESSQPMKTSDSTIVTFGATPETTSDLRPCVVFNIDDHPSRQVAVPPNYRRIGEITRDWERNEKRRQALEEARQWAADKLHGEDGDTVRTLRLRKGWSQSQMAEAIGTSQPHIARIERGTENLTIQTCRRLCDVLGIDMSTLDLALRRQEAIAQRRLAT